MMYIKQFIVCAFVLFPLLATAANKDAAQKLMDLNEKIEAVTLLTHLNEVDSYINKPSRCGKKVDALQKIQSKQRKLNSDYKAGQISGSNYSNSFDSYSNQEKEAAKTFNSCFRMYLNGLSQSYPDVLALNKSTYKELSNTYFSILRQYNYHSGVSPSEELEKLVEKRKTLIRNNNDMVAILIAHTSGVKVHRNPGGTSPAKKGEVLLKGDGILTGPQGIAKILFLDHYLHSAGRRSTLDIMENSSILIESPGIDFSKIKPFTTIELLRGIVRALWNTGHTGFSVRAGTTLCGIRGTDIEIIYDPDDERVLYRLHEGIVDITTPSEKFVLNPGHEVSVTRGYRGEIRRIQTAPPL